jgi:EPS-associated MarR family transcriptional regulator
MDYPEKTFQVLDTLDTQEILTQRQLADHAGISLGQVNYILKSLLERGLVKIGNFRKTTHKIGYMYLLTPKGIEAKSKLAVRFILSKLYEYNDLRSRLAERLCNISEKGHVHILPVGPQVVLNFVESIIREKNLQLKLVDHLENWKNLSTVDPESFDVALLFDDNSESIKKIANALELPRNKLIPLW